MKRGRLRQVSAKRRAQNNIRRIRVAALYEADPRCARCRRADVPLAGHERLARSQGGDPTNPDVLLCHECNTWCEDNPKAAAEAGWKVSRKYDPIGEPA